MYVAPTNSYDICYVRGMLEQKMEMCILLLRWNAATMMLKPVWNCVTMAEIKGEAKRV